MESCNPKNITGTNYSNECQYVKNVSACLFDSGFLNYFEWQYCGFDSRIVPTILMILWFLVLLLSVATTADSFFAPCLVVVTKILRMSQNLAGVTLLALGNGAADVFSSLSAILSSNNPNVGLALGSILGAGILVNTITAGIIMIICPFEIMRRPIIKDIIFYLIALLWCTIILLRRKIEFWSSIVFLSIYIVYVFVTAISRALYLKLKKCQKQERPIENIEVSVTNTVIFNNDRRLDSSKCKANKNCSHDPLNNGQINASYLNENAGEFLKVPQYNQLNRKLNNPTRSAEASVVDIRTSFHRCSRKPIYSSLNLTRVRSTSHRSMGSFAKIIIKNEHEREIMKKNSKVKVSKKCIKRSVSLSALNDCSVPKLKIRFYSADTNMAARRIEEFKNIAVEKLKKKSISDVQNQRTESNLSRILQSNRNDDSSFLTFPGTFKHFLLTILPVDLDDWPRLSVFKKILAIVQSPIMFILTLTISVVEEDVFLKGWCKILNCLHCVLSPLIWITFIHVNMNPIGTDGFIVTYLILIIGLLAGISVAITSKSNSPPIYQPFFAFMGFITSIFWIYEIVNEIVNVLGTLGVVFSIPQTILGLSILAFANSVGDLVSNITLAKRNYPRIAYAACIGGPLFNLLVGIGLPFSIKTAQKPILINLKSDTVVLVFTISLVTTMNLIVLPILKFRVNKIYGIILLTIYIVFFILIISFATNLINVTI